jgi:hypothetical protein
VTWLSLSFLLLAASLAAEPPAIPGRFIVELTAEPVASFLASRQSAPASALHEHRAAVRAQQRQVRAELEKRGVRVLYALETVANALVIQLDGDPSPLTAIPGVKRVTPVRRADVDPPPISEPLPQLPHLARLARRA